MKARILLFGVGIIVALSALAGAFLWQCSDDWCFVFNWQKVRAVESFERCVGLGFPVMESYPRRCAANGKMYTEQSTSIDVGHNDLIRLSTPAAGAIIESPLSVSGVARGTWYFEASFPVKLLDGNGKEIAVVPAQAKSDWMTTEFVPFETVLTFERPQTPTGTLVLQKDNPSDFRQYDDSISIPIRFESRVPAKDTGILSGTMTIGPICPVERIDRPCTPSPEMYAARKVFVYGRDKQTLMAEITPDAQGKWSATLSPGTYFVDMTHQPIGGIDGVPAIVEIVAGKTVSLAVSVDTGIR